MRACSSEQSVITAVYAAHTVTFCFIGRFLHSEGSTTVPEDGSHRMGPKRRRQWLASSKPGK